MIQLPNEPAKSQSILIWARQVNEYLRALTPRSSGSVQVSMSARGTTYSAVTTRRHRGGGSSATHPWQVSVVGTAGDPPTPQLGVYLHSSVLRGMDVSDRISITGLYDPDDPGGEISASAPLVIYLRGSMNEDGDDTESIEVNSGTDWNDGLDFYPLPYEFDSSDRTWLEGGSPSDVPSDRKQTAWYVPIAYVRADDSYGGIQIGDGLYLVQSLYDNLRLTWTCSPDGPLIQMPVPWHGPVLTD